MCASVQYLAAQLFHGLCRQASDDLYPGQKERRFGHKAKAGLGAGGGPAA